MTASTCSHIRFTELVNICMSGGTWTWSGGSKSVPTFTGQGRNSPAFACKQEMARHDRTQRTCAVRVSVMIRSEALKAAGKPALAARHLTSD